MAKHVTDGARRSLARTARSLRGEVIGGLNIDASVGRKIIKWLWNSSKPFNLCQKSNEQQQRLEWNNSSTTLVKTIMG